jgi:glutamate synthase domain-containing protein 2
MWIARMRQAQASGVPESGCWLNTGEGGLARYHRGSGADLVFQIGPANRVHATLPATGGFIP